MSADYVVLGRWESIFFDAAWCDAQEFDKPIVTPTFVTDSFKNQRLMDPVAYRSSQQPSHLRPRIPPRTSKRPRATRSRAPSMKSPKWLRSFKKAERTNPFLWIEALFKANPELTGVALAIRLHEEVGVLDFSCRATNSEVSTSSCRATRSTHGNGSILTTEA